MELKANQIIELEVSHNEKSYRLSLPVGAPLGDAYNAVISMANNLVQMMQKDLNKRSDNEGNVKEEET